MVMAGATALQRLRRLLGACKVAILQCLPDLSQRAIALAVAVAQASKSLLGSTEVARL